jgi:peptidoglycan DL-endopeptidase CwlO
MPVQAVLPADPTATTPSPGTTTTVEPGFAAALDAQAGAPPEPSRAVTNLAQLRTVSLGVMVGALAGGPSASIGAAVAGPAAGAGVQTAAVSDAWGASSARPGGVGGAGQAVLDAGERYLGVPYKWGGTSAATGFDCSGFVQQVYQDLGIKLPRVSVDQSRAGTEVAGGMSNAQPGDLVFWRGNGSRPNHIGIYAGEGRMLVAPRTGDVVRYQEITRTPDAVRRVL